MPKDDDQSETFRSESDQGVFHREGELLTKHSGQKGSPQFPTEFLRGTAISVYQNSGDPNTNWAWFEEQKKVKANFRLRLSSGEVDNHDDLLESHDSVFGLTHMGAGPPVIEKGYKIGISSDFWNRYEEDIQLSKDIGCNSFRLSLEWSRIVPQQGVVDQQAISRYHQIFDALDRAGIQANVTLYWFTMPLWFMDLGGFEKEVNIALFADWARLAFKHFGKRSHMWSTINEPGVAAMCGYIAGNHPPGKKAHFKLGGTVLCNTLRAHTAAYDAIKAMPGSEKTAVGIVHNVFWLEPKEKGFRYSHVKGVLKLANRVWANQVVFDYLKTGRFEYQVPFRANVTYEEPGGRPGCDFIGVNHYSRAVVNWKMQPDSKRHGADLTDMDYPVYPPSLYRSISYASTLGLPIYVMENGIPGTKDDPKRKEWIDGCLKMVKKALQDGFDVRGYMYWTLIDNFEWNFAWVLKFGLFEMVTSDGNPSGKRVLKKGSEALIEWYENEGDELTALVQKNGKDIPKVKSKSERRQLEDAMEREYLINDGVEEAELENIMSQDEPAEYTADGENYQRGGR